MASSSAIDAATVRAYLETEYIAQAEVPLVLRIGEGCPALAAEHGRRRIACSAFVTACNPYSRRLDEATNRQRHADLGRALRQDGLSFLEGVGRHPSADWPAEASYLVFGLDLEAAQALGRRLDQNAIVWSGSDAVPQLVLLR